MAAIVILIVALCYAIIRIFPHLEGFEQYGAIGAFLVAFICSTTIIFYAPGFLVIWAMAASPAFSWPLVALASGVGGALGEFTAYLAGYGGVVVIHPERSKLYKRAEYWMRHHGSATIFIFSLTWLPFDFIGIAAGALRFPFWKFMLANLAGRMPRSFIGCYLAYLGWELLPELWDSLRGLAWWNWVIIGVGAAVIIGGIIIIIWRRRRAAK